MDEEHRRLIREIDNGPGTPQEKAAARKVVEEDWKAIQEQNNRGKKA